MSWAIIAHLTGDHPNRDPTAVPERLREEIETAGVPPGGRVVVDEIRKAPALPDEAHRLIEKRGFRFALCGSSARKVQRGAANLPGARAGAALRAAGVDRGRDRRRLRPDPRAEPRLPAAWCGDAARADSPSA